MSSAVLWVRLKWSDRGVTADEKAVREYAESYLVKTAAPDIDAVTVTADVRIPRMFQIYKGTDGSLDFKIATARRIEAHNHADDPRMWDVLVHYSNRTDQPGLGDPDPEARPPEFGWKPSTQSVVATQDVNGKALVNSSGEKFDPPVEEDEVIQTFTFKRVESVDPNPVKGNLYLDAVNSDTFMGYPPGYAKCTELSSNRRYENNRYYFDANYEVQFKNPAKPTGWQTRVLDQGYYRLDSANRQTPILDPKSGQPYQGPTLLDGVGGLLSDAAIGLGAPISDTDTVMVTSTAPGPKWIDNAAYPVAVQIGGTTGVITDAVHEIVLVTGKAAGPPGSYTIQRGAYGTTAASHANGANLQLQPVYLAFTTKPPRPFAALNINPY